jgi:hypothetical protein
VDLAGEICRRSLVYNRKTIGFRGQLIDVRFVAIGIAIDLDFLTDCHLGKVNWRILVGSFV